MVALFAVLVLAACNKKEEQPANSMARATGCRASGHAN